MNWEALDHKISDDPEAMERLAKAIHKREVEKAKERVRAVREEREESGIPNWEGVQPDAEERPHRTTGNRAWCLNDSMWCYEHIPCQCCMEVGDDWEVCGACAGEGYVIKGNTNDQGGVIPV